MKKTKISFYFVFIAFLTFLTIFFSIIQKSYFSFIKPQKLVENNTLLKSFDPSLDSSVISLIESKYKNTDDSFDFSIINSHNNSSDQISPKPLATDSKESSTSSEINNSVQPQ